MFRILVLSTGFFLSFVANAATPIETLQKLIDRSEFIAAAQQGTVLMVEQPKNTRARFLTAYAYQKSGQSKKAVSLYRRLIADHPDLPAPRNNLAMIYLDQGDSDRASQLLIDAINTHASYATAYQNLSRVYKGLASEAYRRAVNESGQEAKLPNNIKLAAINKIEWQEPVTVAVSPPVTVAVSPPVTVAVSPPVSIAVLAPLPVAVSTATKAESLPIVVVNQEAQLVGQVKRWARVWSNKNFIAYTRFYSPQYRANFNTHAEWLKYRQQRIVRPGTINIEVSDFSVELVDAHQAVADFRQAFSSPNYKDQVLKRLNFKRSGSEWKITQEQVLSTL